MRRLRILPLVVGALALASAAFAAPAVGAHLPASDPKPQSNVQQVDVVALASIRLDQDVYRVAKPGKVRITVSGAAGMAIVLRERRMTELVTHGQPNSVVLTLRRGTYHLESAIPAHTAAGIHALLIVG